MVWSQLLSYEGLACIVQYCNSIFGDRLFTAFDWSACLLHFATLDRQYILCRLLQNFHLNIFIFLWIFRENVLKLKKNFLFIFLFNSLFNSSGAVLWLPDVCYTCLHFFIFCWFLATYSIKFYIIGFVSSCCVQWTFDCRVLKSVDGIIGLESSS